MHLFLSPGQLEYEGNDRKVRGKHILKGRKEKENPKYTSLLPVKIITGPWHNGLV